jgi:hypothetical protein
VKVAPVKGRDDHIFKTQPRNPQSMPSGFGGGFVKKKVFLPPQKGSMFKKNDQKANRPALIKKGQ